MGCRATEKKKALHLTYTNDVNDVSKDGSTNVFRCPLNMKRYCFIINFYSEFIECDIRGALPSTARTLADSNCTYGVDVCTSAFYVVSLYIYRYSTGNELIPHQRNPTNQKLILNWNRSEGLFHEG
jgi:hypothetical protein